MHSIGGLGSNADRLLILLSDLRTMVPSLFTRKVVVTRA